MKISTSRVAFLDALQAASRAVPGRTTKEILRNVKLLALRGATLMLATDGELGLRVEIPDLTVEDPGEALLPTARLIEVLSTMDNAESVTIKLDTGKLIIKGGASEFTLLTEDPKDFPAVATFEDAAFFTMKVEDLQRLIRRTIFATDENSTRYALGGLQVELNDGKATFAATDSRRLAVDYAVLENFGGATAPEKPPIVPRKAMKLLASIGVGESAQLAIHANDIAIRCGRYTITSQLVQGRFPEWRKVIPSGFRVTLDMVVGPFLAAIKQAMIVRNEESRGVEFILTKGQLRLTSGAADLGASKVDLPVAYDGEKLQIHFDPQWFADVLKVLDSGSVVQLKLISPEDPAFLEAGSYGYVIMPLSRDK